MKINEKNLIAYSILRDYVDKEGYLLKRGEVNKAFQRRWFVLKGNLLFYFEKKGDKEPLGLIVLEGCRTELAESDEHYVFKLIFSGPNLRVYEFGTELQEELESWMKFISRASYDYLKIMVAELQTQLEEIEESTKATCDRKIVPPTAFGSFPMSGYHRPRENPFNRNEDMSYSDLWKCNEPLQSAAALLSKSSRDSCAASFGSGYANVNPSLPPSIPFRSAPPPPIVTAPSRSSSSRISFTILHDKYGVSVLESRNLYTSIKLARPLHEETCPCDNRTFHKVNVIEETLIDL